MRGAKRAVAIWHRRAGKDDVFLNHMICAAHERIGNYWYMLPKYTQARKALWEAINPNTGKLRLDTIIPYELRASTNQQEMRIVLKCGSAIQLVGSDAFNALVGSPPVGLGFSEYALCNPSAWAYLMPIVEENNGYAFFNSTPRGKNHLYKLSLMARGNPRWAYSKLSSDDTRIFDPGQLRSIKDELVDQYGTDFGTALFEQEYNCSFDSAIIGAIWADCIHKLQFEGKIGEYPHVPAYPVHTVWDLGSADATAIWFFQIIGQDIHVIDCHESNFKDVPFYNEYLRSKPYSYGSLWLPHDGFARHFAAGGKSIDMQFTALNKDGKLGKISRVPGLPIQHGIQAARATFPRCVINAGTCNDGLEALLNYHNKYDDEKKIFSNEPEHDWSSHFADSFRYLSLVWKEARDIKVKPFEQRLMENSITGMSMGKLMKNHLKGRKNGTNR